MKTKKYKIEQITINHDKKRKPLSAKQRADMQGKYRYYGAQSVIDYVNDYLFDGEYLLIAEDGENLKSGKQNIAQIVEGQFWLNNHAHIVQTNELCNIRFLGYWLNSADISGYITGSAQPKLSQANLNAIEIFLPSRDIQDKIVNILYSFDQKIEINNQINRNLSEQASAYYENWKMSLTGEAVELSKVIDVRDGTHASPKPQDEGYPLVTSKHLFEYDVDLESPNKISKEDYDKTNERSKVEYHDVLMSMIGTVGVVSFISRQEIHFAIKNVALFRTSQREELAYYVLLFLKSKDTKQYIKSCMAGSTQQYISLTELRKIPIIVPGEEIKEFNLVIKPIIDMICANVIENRRLSELGDTLLPKLMSGELDVSDLDI